MGGKIGGREAQVGDLVQIYYLEKECLALEQKTTDAKEKLKHLQYELALTEQKKESVEVQIKKREDDRNVLMEETEELKKQKSSLEEQCANLSARSERIRNDLNEKSKELQDKSTELEEAKNQLDYIGGQKGFGSKKRKFAIITIVAILVVIFLYSNYYNKERFQSKITELDTLYQNSLKVLSDVEDLYQGLLENLLNEEEDKLFEAIKINSIYNVDNEGLKISDDLKASEMRYLCFEFHLYYLRNVSDNDFTRLLSEGTTVYIDIYKPDGSLMISDSDSVAHTGFVDVDAHGCGRQGWGNPETSVYTSGSYRIDFICNDKLIHSQKVEITP